MGSRRGLGAVGRGGGGEGEETGVYSKVGLRESLPPPPPLPPPTRPPSRATTLGRIGGGATHSSTGVAQPLPAGHLPPWKGGARRAGTVDGRLGREAQGMQTRRRASGHRPPLLPSPRAPSTVGMQPSAPVFARRFVQRQERIQTSAHPWQLLKQWDGGGGVGRVASSSIQKARTPPALQCPQLTYLARVGLRSGRSAVIPTVVASGGGGGSGALAAVWGGWGRGP